MRIAAFALLVDLSLAAVSVPLGLIITAYAYSARGYITAFLNLYYFRRVFGVTIRASLGTVMPALISSILMFSVLAGLKASLLAASSPGMSLIILSITGGLIYVALMLTIFRNESENFFIESVDFLPEKYKPAALILRRLFKISPQLQ